MTSDAPRVPVHRRIRKVHLAFGAARRAASGLVGRVIRAEGSPVRAGSLALLLAGLAAGQAGAAEPSYPFEGTWVRSNRVCAANAPRVRTYTAREVTFPTGHCTFRKVAQGGGQWEIFEECRKAESPGNYTETIRMLGPDLMQMRRQAARLKIARPLRYTRCSVAAPGAPVPGPAKAAAPHRPADDGDKPAEAAKP